MKTITLAMALILVCGYAAGDPIVPEKMQERGEMPDLSNLLEAVVKKPNGDVLGSITEIVTGPDQRIAFAILSYWVSDDTQKRVAVPLTALSCEGRNCVLVASKNMLDSAPEFVSKDDLAESRLAEDIYRYFGVQPYWTDDVFSKTL